MERKAEIPKELLDRLAGQPLLAAMTEFNQLKNLYRQGWLRRGIPREQCESVADHIFGMTWLAWLLMDAGLTEDVDRERVLRMVLAHEVGEIYAGDMIPADGVEASEKQRLERESALRVVGKLAGGEEILALWEEFEAGQTPEARLVRQLDRLEMAFQAAQYRAGGAQGTGEFFESARRSITDEGLLALLTEIEGV
ncbi:MAG: HD domain-containing protein [Anaerolineaceae bacterium]|nr:HD domain-containing protein [Anaerolineaceae bacterium]